MAFAYVVTHENQTDTDKVKCTLKILLSWKNILKGSGNVQERTPNVSMSLKCVTIFLTVLEAKMKMAVINGLVKRVSEQIYFRIPDLLPLWTSTHLSMSFHWFHFPWTFLFYNICKRDGIDSSAAIWPVRTGLILSGFWM